MARLDTNSARLRVAHDSMPTTATVSAATLQCEGRLIKAAGSVELVGTPGESAAGWKLGFAQLEYAEGNFANYRGRTNNEGSVHLNWNHAIVARDTDETAPSVFYDPPSLGVVNGRGTFTAPSGLTIPASGRLTLSSMMDDQADNPFPCTQTNPAARNATNFLYHAYATFMFYTALIAQEPNGHFHILQHFYWNVRWDVRAEPAGANSIRITNQRPMALTVGRVHSGNASDQRFASRVVRSGLPVANDLANRDPHRQNLPVWG